MKLQRGYWRRLRRYAHESYSKFTDDSIADINLDLGSINMKLLILLFAVLLSACSAQNKCVRVAYFDYGNIGCIQHIYQFQGTYYPNSKIVITNKYLGDGNTSMFEQCTNPADLSEGWYSVLIDEGMGTWVLNGEGFKGKVDIFPNAITQKALAKITK